MNRTITMTAAAPSTADPIAHETTPIEPASTARDEPEHALGQHPHEAEPGERAGLRGRAQPGLVGPRRLMPWRGER